MSYYKDKLSLVTGGASGIGKSLCRQILDQGGRVIVADFNRRAAEATAGQLGCSAAVYDVRNLEEAKKAIEQAQAEHGPIDYLFNNAGKVQTGEAHTFDYKDYKDIIDINLFGVINGIHILYPQMVERGSGHIINTASIAGLFPMAGQVSYVASKHAVVGLSQALRAEAAAYGVRVSVACPGIIKTPMREKLPLKGDNASKVLELLPEGMPVEQCAAEILQGAAKNEGTIVVTPMAHMLYMAKRFHPDVGVWLSEQFINYIRREAGN